jgi:hypothetical protein
MTQEDCIIYSLIIILIAIIIANISNKERFYSNLENPDKVLESYAVHGERGGFLPPNQVILKGHNSDYWNCFELNKSLGASNNEILQKCGQFII